MSAFQKVQQKRSASKDRSSSKDRSKITNKPPEEANQPFDKLFGSKDAQGASAARGRAADRSAPTSTPFGPATTSKSSSSFTPVGFPSTPNYIRLCFEICFCIFQSIL